MPEAHALADTIIQASEDVNLEKRLKQRFEKGCTPTVSIIEI